MLAVYFRAMVISLALVSSIGMQNIYAFNNAMSNALRRALLVAGFIWIADTLLTSIAFLGMGALIAANQVIKIIVMGLGGLVVIWMGYGIVRGANAASFGNDHQEQSLKQWFTGAFVVSFANPQALIDTSVTLGALRSPLTMTEAWVFLGGIITSTALWFFVVTTVINLLRNRLPRRVLMWINIASGIVVMFYGVRLVVSAVLAVI